MHTDTHFVPHTHSPGHSLLLTHVAKKMETLTIHIIIFLYLTYTETDH